ncbi:protein-tyrosine phosphatase-like protein [Triangularia verruculosa]|uniref:Protein-tyrosine phosphatase-like protein n=1 Tax=Triangularia verruculosa TaxID=2587418 RepID=A0AAN6XF34_9PEZI|nr:protein-tyrosine phosphatase-like protein [Triangularia verruculosa]
MDMEKEKAPIAEGVVRSAETMCRPPSPPYIHVPPFSPRTTNPATMLMHLSPSELAPYAGGGDLSDEELRQLFSYLDNQQAIDSSHAWQYAHRRLAQPILDFLYLGPASAARDRDFLREKGITLILGIRDSRYTGMLKSIERAAEEVGISADTIDVPPMQPLVGLFGIAIQKINAHLVAVARSSPLGHRKGRVLVVCETGNERSATFLAAYLMSMFSLDLVQAIQFVTLQRFCVSFSDTDKLVLRTYQDILQAKRDVTRNREQREADNEGQENVRSMIKRRLSRATSSLQQQQQGQDRADGHSMELDGEYMDDVERFKGGEDMGQRRAFAPFISRED